MLQHYVKWKESDTKATYSMIHWYEMPQMGKSLETEMGVTAKRVQEFFARDGGDDEDVLKLDAGDGCAILWMYFTDLHTLKGWFLWYANYM